VFVPDEDFIVIVFNVVLTELIVPETTVFETKTSITLSPAELA